jgi:hypothetical protein
MMHSVLVGVSDIIHPNYYSRKRIPLNPILSQMNPIPSIVYIPSPNYYVDRNPSLEIKRARLGGKYLVLHPMQNYVTILKSPSLIPA